MRREKKRMMSGAPKNCGEPKSKMPAFSRKNSRFSGKNRLKRVRSICSSSASTWAKSVFTVRSSTRPEASPSLASAPTSPSKSTSPVRGATQSCAVSPRTYGFT